MLREFYSTLSKSERVHFYSLLGVSGKSLQNKYLSPDRLKRQLPSKERFNLMLVAANTVKANSLTRAGLATYFYSAANSAGHAGLKAA